MGRTRAKGATGAWVSRHALAVYIAFIVLAGTAATVRSIYALMRDPAGVQWYALLVLTLASGTALLKIPGITANFSVSDTFTITASMLFGETAAKPRREASHSRSIPKALPLTAPLPSGNTEA